MNIRHYIDLIKELNEAIVDPKKPKRKKSSTEIAAAEGWRDASVGFIGGENQNKYAPGTLEHEAYETSFDSAIENLSQAMDLDAAERED